MERDIKRRNDSFSEDLIRKKIYAVVGNPVLHSLSPPMFNEAFRVSSINGVYTRIAAYTAEEALEVAREIGMAGINVTAPFKEAMYALVDEVEGEAKEIGAINTVLFEGGLSKGFNTDVAGVKDAFYANGVPLKGKRVLLLGSGGAASAAAYALKGEGAEVTIINRTHERAEMLAERMGCKTASFKGLNRAIETADIIVSTISFTGTIVKPELLKETQVIFDANYREETQLVRDGKRRGCRIIDGREWLIYQGAKAFKYFTGFDAPINVMQDAIYRNDTRRKRHIALIGFMGSGKTTIGQRLAKRHNMYFIDMDRVIEERSGVSIKEIFKNDGEEAFRKMEEDELKNLKNINPSVVSCGGGVVLKEKNRDILKENCINIWLWADIETLAQRVKGDGSRPLLEGVSGKEDMERMVKMRIPYYGDVSDMVISTANKRIEEVISRCYDESSSTIER
ncbi:MAG: shikimate dehydrogenase [Syntrophorhabdaceae bacterium]|nr:shikimate dehydrogenase [Syntrophorhabdaceae bacterium]